MLCWAQVPAGMGTGGSCATGQRRGAGSTVVGAVCLARFRPCPACKPLRLYNLLSLLPQRAGYDTYLIGKLLNGFTEASVSAGCPRGWSVLGGWVGGRAKGMWGRAGRGVCVGLVGNGELPTVGDWDVCRRGVDGPGDWGDVGRCGRWRRVGNRAACCGALPLPLSLFVTDNSGRCLTRPQMPR